MYTRWAALALLAAVLALPRFVAAHEGHTHNVLGTVASVHGNHVEVNARDGASVTVMLDAKTTITRGGDTVDVAEVKPGERVSIDYVQEKNMNMATSVKLGTAPSSGSQ